MDIRNIIMLHSKSAKFLENIKFPLAILSLALLPAACLQLYYQVLPLVHDQSIRSPFVLGFLSFFIFMVIFSHFTFNLFMTFEHELTHGIFAILTFNKVVALKVFENGGKLEYEGTSNWLILLAPYFFPTVALCVGVAIGLLDQKLRWWGQFWLGTSIAYQLFSTVIETELKQRDLIECGLAFSVVTLPFLNALSYILLTAYMTGGWHGILLSSKALITSQFNPIMVIDNYLIKIWKMKMLI